jgi:hypothetical protein
MRLGPVGLEVGERLNGASEWRDAPSTCQFGGWERLNGLRERRDAPSTFLFEGWECLMALKSPVVKGGLGAHTGNLEPTRRFPCAVAYQTGGGLAAVATVRSKLSDKKSPR